LAAATIEDNRTDYRNMFVGLGGIYLAAARVGIDVSDCFRETSQWSSLEPNPLLNIVSEASPQELATHLGQASQAKLPQSELGLQP